MSTFYGIGPDEVPAFATTGDYYHPIDTLPQSVQDNIHLFIEQMRAMDDTDPIAFETAVLFVATVIEEHNGAQDAMWISDIDVPQWHIYDASVESNDWPTVCGLTLVSVRHAPEPDFDPIHPRCHACDIEQARRQMSS